MLSCLILWADHGSKNLGVRALAEGTATIARRAWGDVAVAHQGYGPGDAPVRVGAWRPYVRRLTKRHDVLIDWVRTFDVVIDTRAGDSFADIYGLSRLTTMCLLHEVVLRAGVPLVLGPQTVGPFETGRGRLMARRVLRTAELTFARDGESAGVANALGARRVEPTTDVVFSLDEPVTEGNHDVLLNVSGLLWGPNPHVDHLAYQGIIRSAIEALTDRGRSVVLLAHVLDSPIADNDVPAVAALSAEFGVPAVIPADLDDARREIAGANLVIAARMHACLNALSVGVPAIPLAYSRKFQPLLSRLGWDHTLRLDADAEIVSRLVELAEGGSLLQDARRVRDRARVESEQAAATLRQAVTL
jgi:colanic acid/amylovoran biosynthesis protein